MTSSKSWWLMVLTSALIFSAPAKAGLGQDEASVDQGRMHLHAHRTTAQDGFVRTHELRGPDGSRVLQYVGYHGQVFAVSWDAPIKLNIEQIMGTSYSEYKGVVDRHGQKGGIQRRLIHTSADLAFVSGGHLNHFWGYALRKNLVPPGFDVSRLGRE